MGGAAPAASTSKTRTRFLKTTWSRTSLGGRGVGFARAVRQHRQPQRHRKRHPGHRSGLWLGDEQHQSVERAPFRGCSAALVVPANVTLTIDQGTVMKIWAQHDGCMPGMILQPLCRRHPRRRGVARPGILHLAQRQHRWRGDRRWSLYRGGPGDWAGIVQLRPGCGRIWSTPRWSDEAACGIRGVHCPSSIYLRGPPTPFLKTTWSRTSLGWTTSWTRPGRSTTSPTSTAAGSGTPAIDLVYAAR